MNIYKEFNKYYEKYKDTLPKTGFEGTCFGLISLSDFEGACIGYPEYLNFTDWDRFIHNKKYTNFYIQFLDMYSKKPMSKGLKDIIIEGIKCDIYNKEANNELEKKKIFGLTEYFPYLFCYKGYREYLLEGLVKGYLYRSLDMIGWTNKATKELSDGGDI